MQSIEQLAAYKALVTHQSALSGKHLRSLLQSDPHRAAQFTQSACGLTLDYTRHRATTDTLSLLFNLAREARLTEQLTQLMTGQPVNVSENRPALHTALRANPAQPVFVKQSDVMPTIQATRQRMTDFVMQIRNNELRGCTDKPFETIVNIGIGGSFTGPMMAIEALQDFIDTPLRFLFLSTVDPALLDDILADIQPDTTLFIISSKSFTTIETSTNTQLVMDWMKQKLGPAAFPRHFIAVTANETAAGKLGLPSDRIFPLWEWVGGRYSVWSAIGLPLMLAIGPRQFNAFLSGAYAMDEHVIHAPLEHNLPVILALLGIWYINFHQASAYAVIPYAYRLRSLITWLQQAEMESNGKQIQRDGTAVTHLTSPIIFGQEGCIGQHTYHQLLHQGTHLIPVDFIVVERAFDAKRQSQQDILTASAYSQAQALAQGKTREEAFAELANGRDAEAAIQLAQHKIIPGNRPSTFIRMEQLTPATLGALLALYEHKIAIQSFIWNINAFDQWGVELGKALLPDALSYLQSKRREHL